MTQKKHMIECRDGQLCCRAARGHGMTGAMVVLMAFWTLCFAPFIAFGQEPANPLKPPDRSSPRAALDKFLDTGDALGTFLAEDYLPSPSREKFYHMMLLNQELQEDLDLSHLPPAARDRAGLYSPNARFIEDTINRSVADNPAVRHIILECPAVNTIDASALESLEAVNARLKAWSRTSLSLIGFGFTIYKFLGAMQMQSTVPVLRPQAPRNLGLMLIGLGTGALIAAGVQYVKYMKKLDPERPFNLWDLSLTVACLLVLIGLLMFGSIYAPFRPPRLMSM